MELKNNFSVTKEEASNLLNNLANSLKNRGKFEITLANQEISLDIGEELSATLVISETNFSVDFTWKRAGTKSSTDVNWREKFDKDMADAGLPITDEIKSPGKARATSSLRSPPGPTPKSSGPIPANTIPSTPTPSVPKIKSKGLGPRKLKEQMTLETTTLPYEGGVWNPAFSLTHQTHWTEIGINNQLENTKWITDADIVSLDAPGSSRQPTSDNDDLFTDLDSVDPLSSRPSGKKGSKQAVTPAAMLFNTSPSDLDDASIAEAAAEWSEPSSEENTGDEWVKPSEVIKKKKAKVAKIAKGTKSKVVPPVGSLDQKEAGSEILQWTEPEAEEDTEDEWVKPSEFLKENKKTDKGSQPPVPKKQKKQKKDSKGKKTRPPPVPPDDDDDKSKGWASWKD
ncbi:MAG: hypothetical protein HeimC2_25400 [Candidatus Heimdallarchaeota archaeon LC_2]|nr:MAG: hypothetical protein HeimC2_25400 [Candidatus Heimdallarchaeota archaeon LC_2]